MRLSAFEIRLNQRCLALLNGFLGNDMVAVCISSGPLVHYISGGKIYFSLHNLGFLASALLPKTPCYHISVIYELLVILPRRH